MPYTIPTAMVHMKRLVATPDGRQNHRTSPNLTLDNGSHKLVQGGPPLLYRFPQNPWNLSLNHSSNHGKAVIKTFEQF